MFFFKILLFSILIRIFSFLFLILFSYFIPCFDCSSHFNFNYFQSLIRWDTLHFFSLDSIERREQHFAFSPGLFKLIHLIKPFVIPFNSFLNFNIFLLLSICLLSILFSTASSIILFYLTIEIFHSIEFAKLTTILHILSPSPSTQVIPYTEPFFSFFSFSTIYLHILINKYSSSLSNSKFKFLLFKLFLACSSGLATFFRSLGILQSFIWCFDFLDFLIHLIFQKKLDSNNKSLSKKLLTKIIIKAIETIIMILITCSPFIYDQWIGYQQFCQFKPNQNYNLEIHNRTRPWCLNLIPSIYNFVQIHYWGNGFLKYWTWNQFPLFILSFPIYWVTIKSLFEYYKYYFKFLKNKNNNQLKEEKEIFYRPFLTNKIQTQAHIQLILIIILLFNSHVQIILRQASTMPFIWWGIADQIGLNWNWWYNIKINSNNKKLNSIFNILKFNLIYFYFYWLIIWWPISLLLWIGFYPPA